MPILTSHDRKRLVYVVLFLFFLFALLLVQFYRIQVLEGDKWKRAANRQHQQVVIEPYCRGIFYSNTALKTGHPEKEQPLVIDVPRFHLYADPLAIPEKCRLEVIHYIQTIFKLGPSDVTKLSNQLSKKSRSRKLILWASRDMYDALLKWWQPYAKSHKIPRNALFFVHDYKRAYPFGKLLGQVLHTIRSERDQTGRQCIPTGGLELSLNKYLQGEDGKRVILRSPRQPLDTGKVIVEPKHGCDVFLTINHHLQAIAEEEVSKAVKGAGAKAGWALMMDPYSGAILAWAQYPFFDPSHYRDYFNDKSKEEFTKVKAITDPYEPGSIMKPMTLAVALQANAVVQQKGQSPLFSRHEKMATAIGNFPGRGKPLKDLHTHKYLNMYMGLQKSSNVYMAKRIQQVVEALGDGWYRSMLEQVFGFGIKTGVELPGESAALLPMPGKTHPNGKLEWSKATPYSLAMGHNILANSLQMLRCYAILANGGFDVKPTLIRKIVSKKGETLVDHTLPSSPKRVLEPAVVKEVVTALRFITKPGGTAKRANIPFYTEAGKTGTSEKVINGVYSKRDHISTFVGFAPATNPRFVLLVAIDEPEYKYVPGVGKNQQAGICAAPAFREIGFRTLQFLGIPQDDPKNEAWDPEVQKLKALYEQWNH